MLFGIAKSNFFASIQSVRQASFLPRATVNAIKTLVEAPKNAPNAYSMFYSEQYPEFQKQFPNFKITEIAKRIGAKWQSLTAATKKTYTDRAMKGLEGSKQKNEQWRSKLTANQSFALHMVRMNTKARRGEITKRYLSDEEKAFLAELPSSPFTSGRAVFASTELRKNPKKPITEKVNDLHTAWNALSQAEKAKYEEQAKQDQHQFMNSMKKFLQK